MAQESKRGCGYRHIGGIYLVGPAFFISCDRLPMEVGHCPVCGSGVHFTKGISRIKPLQLWGEHNYLHNDREECIIKDTICICNKGCFVCYPPDKTEFLMMVGAGYYPTPDDFMREAHELGISKRIPFVPKDLVLGESIVYLAHNKAIKVVTQNIEPLPDGQERMITEEEVEYKLGVFTAFRPQRVEKLIWESEATVDELESLDKRGITPVIIRDGDTDHI